MLTAANKDFIFIVKDYLAPAILEQFFCTVQE